MKSNKQTNKNLIKNTKKNNLNQKRNKKKIKKKNTIKNTFKLNVNKKRSTKKKSYIQNGGNNKSNNKSLEYQTVEFELDTNEKKKTYNEWLEIWKTMNWGYIGRAGLQEAGIDRKIDPSVILCISPFHNKDEDPYFKNLDIKDIYSILPFSRIKINKEEDYKIVMPMGMQKTKSGYGYNQYIEYKIEGRKQIPRKTQDTKIHLMKHMWKKLSENYPDCYIITRLYIHDASFLDDKNIVEHLIKNKNLFDSLYKYKSDLGRNISIGFIDNTYYCDLKKKYENLIPSQVKIDITEENNVKNDFKDWVKTILTINDLTLEASSKNEYRVLTNIIGRDTLIDYIGLFITLYPNEKK